MAVCILCSSLDDSQLFQEALRDLSWITEDISVLYKENSAMIEKIKTLNLELEKSAEDQSVFCEDSNEDDVEANAEDILEDLCQEEISSLEKDAWLFREDSLREQLVQQLHTLGQDLSTLQPQHHHLPHHHRHPHLPRHLWGHLTRKWRPPSSALTARARKTKQPKKLLRWLERKTPMNLIDLNC